VSLDHDVDLDHDVSLDHNAEVHGAAGIQIHSEFSHDHNLEQDNDTSVFYSILVMLGVGRVPLSIIGFCWLMIFGFVGLLLNGVWMGIFNSINILFLISGVVAFVTSLTLTSFLARGIGKIMPQTESYGEKKTDLINREAEVLYTVTEQSGTITLYDKFKNYHRLQARRDVSCTTDIPPNTKVVILSYAEKDKEFVVIPADQINQS
jgi:membrane protein implicated in regulation of membrane protease activity